MARYTFKGIRVVGKGIWEERVSWKVQNEIGQIEVGKFEPKLKSSWRSWTVIGEVGKYN